MLHLLDIYYRHVILQVLTPFLISNGNEREDSFDSWCQSMVLRTAWQMSMWQAELPSMMADQEEETVARIKSHL